MRRRFFLFLMETPLYICLKRISNNWQALLCLPKYFTSITMLCYTNSVPADFRKRLLEVIKGYGDVAAEALLLATATKTPLPYATEYH